MSVHSTAAGRDRGALRAALSAARRAAALLRPAPRARPAPAAPARAEPARGPEGGQADFEKEIQEIRAFDRLEKGWDGYDGVASEKRAIDNAVAFLRLLRMGQGAARPAPVPERDGRVGLLWEFPGRGFYLHVSLRPDGTIRWYGDAPVVNRSKKSGVVAFRAGREEDLPEGLRSFLASVPSA